MYESMDVANYIINKCKEKDYNINNLKLQKLLYYANMYQLKKNGSALIEGSFEKWKFGPVFPKVYFAFRHLGKHEIEAPVPIMVTDDDGQLAIKVFDKGIISVDDQKTIDTVVENLGEINRFELVDQTHSEPMWKKYEEKILSGEKNLIYSNEEILEYLKSTDGGKMAWMK